MGERDFFALTNNKKIVNRRYTLSANHSRAANLFERLSAPKLSE